MAPLAALFLALIPALMSAPAAAQKPPASGEAMQVLPAAKAAIDRIKSPYCPGQMLETCPSSGGAMLRDSIQRMAEAGLSADSIVEVIIGEYGDQWRAQPLASGTGLWAWLLPPGALLVGLGVVGVVLVRRRRLDPVASVAADAPDADPEVEARLREALKELDEAEEPVF
jgi:cytochrome c-type biogenesis protein CcmH/NrfF